MSYVLITGATSGIGYEMAKVFGQAGYDLILVGRSEEKLKEAKETLQCEFIKQDTKKEKQTIICIKQDLKEELAARLIYEAVQKLGISVDILINNAGIGYAGEFEEATEAQLMALIMVNITQLTLLTKYFSKEMKARKSGKILNVASTGAYCPGAYIAAYYATKAYVLSLTEAVYEELSVYGVQVSCLCPGATLTSFQKASGRTDTKLALSPEFVAKKAYKGVMKGKRLIIPGIRNKVMVSIPKKIAIKMIKRYQRSTLEK